MDNIERLRSEKKAKKMTLQEISEKSGVPKRTVDDIFSGHTKNPRIDTIQAIEKALGLSSPTVEWTAEDRAHGVVDTIKKDVTAEEDDLLYLYREIGKKKGANAQALALKILEMIKDS